MRLLIVDQSLVGRIGHHYSYDVALARAGTRRGVDAIILGNRKVAKDIATEAGVRIEPWFSRNWRMDDRSELIVLASNIANHFPAAISGRLAVAARRIFAERQPRIADLKRPAARVPPLGLELARAAASLTITDDDIIFVHTVKVGVAAALIEGFELIFAGRRPVLIILLRNPPEIPGEMAALRRAMKLAGAGRWPVALGTDTMALTKLFMREIDAPVATFPIPLGFGDMARSPSLAIDNGTFTIGYLGEARAEKGFLALPKLVASCCREIDGVKIRFAIHAAVPASQVDPRIPPALDRLIQSLRPEDRLSTNVLTDREFTQWIDDCSCVAFPYEHPRYEYASSSVFVAALLRARPAVVPEWTSMAEMLPSSAGVLYAPSRPLPDAIEMLVRRRQAYYHGAAAAATAFARTHSPTGLLEKLLETAFSCRRFGCHSQSDIDDPFLAR